MRAMRRTVLKNDVAAWAAGFLESMAQVGRGE
jgi:hypothetical protein